MNSKVLNNKLQPPMCNTLLDLKKTPLQELMEFVNTFQLKFTPCTRLRKTFNEDIIEQYII